MCAVPSPAQMHRSDPEHWTHEKIARTFGLPRPRVRAILMFAKIEQAVYPNGAISRARLCPCVCVCHCTSVALSLTVTTDAGLPPEIDGSVERMLEEKFGVVLPANKSSRMLLRDEKYLSPRFEMLDGALGAVAIAVFMLRYSSPAGAHRGQGVARGARLEVTAQERQGARVRDAAGAAAGIGGLSQLSFDSGTRWS